MPADIKNTLGLDAARAVQSTITVPAIASSSTGAVKIDNSLNTGVGFQVTSSMDNNSAKPLVQIEATDAAFDQTVLNVVRDPDAPCSAIVAKNEAATIETALCRASASADGTNRFYRNLAAASTAGPIVKIEQENTGDDQPALFIISAAGNKGDILLSPRATADIAASSEGSIAYDSTLHKLRVRGAAGWETISSV